MLLMKFFTNFQLGRRRIMIPLASINLDLSFLPLIMKREFAGTEWRWTVTQGGAFDLGIPPEPHPNDGAIFLQIRKVPARRNAHRRAQLIRRKWTVHPEFQSNKRIRMTES